jgi:hypothetical protein
MYSSVVAGGSDRFVLEEHPLPSFFKGTDEGLYCAVWNLLSLPKQRNTPSITLNKGHLEYLVSLLSIQHVVQLSEFALLAGL